MNVPLLSICVPTYNRINELDYLLNNLTSQLFESGLWSLVEVCISDNASTDGTSTMVEQYQAKYPKIIYKRNLENLGFDRNLLASVAISSGKYCWIFGSDDRFELDAIKTVVENLNKYPETVGISVNVQNYNNDFSHTVKNPGFRLDQDFYSISSEEIYIRLGACFSFISGQIIKKANWDRVISQKNDIARFFNGYIHLYIIAQIVKHSPNWRYLSQRLVGWREGNDSALTKSHAGYIKRLRLDYEYFDIAREVFGAYTWVYYRHGNQICGGAIFCCLQDIKANTKIDIWPLFFEITVKFWVFPNYYIKLLPVFLLPKPILNFIKKVKRIFRNMLGN